MLTNPKKDATYHVASFFMLLRAKFTSLTWLHRAIDLGVPFRAGRGGISQSPGNSLWSVQLPSIGYAHGKVRYYAANAEFGDGFPFFRLETLPWQIGPSGSLFFERI
jgi:hypothetical protein